jgi:alpha-N-arabinofuranosidase
VTGDSVKPGYWVAGFNSNTGSYILKTAVYNGSGALPMTVTFSLPNLSISVLEVKSS